MEEETGGEKSRKASSGSDPMLHAMTTHAVPFRNS
jgi:hypothetical protein